MVTKGWLGWGWGKVFSMGSDESVLEWGSGDGENNHTELLNSSDLDIGKVYCDRKHMDLGQCLCSSFKVCKSAHFFEPQL